MTHYFSTQGSAAGGASVLAARTWNIVLVAGIWRWCTCSIHTEFRHY